MKTRNILNKIQSLPPGLNYTLSRYLLNNDLLFGKGYREYKKKLTENYQYYNNADDLIHLVNDAVQFVPFYKNKYGPITISSVEQFKNVFNLIDKTVVNAHFNEFFSTKEDKSKYDLMTTGGTSGKPLRLYLPKKRFVQELGTLHVMWEKAFNYDGGFKAVIKNHKLNRDFEINPVTKEFIFDGFIVSESYFEKVYQVMKKYDIGYILCYPSSGYEFAKFLERNKKDVSFIRAIVASSENVQDFQLKLFTEKLGIPFFIWYGHTEKLVSAGYCKGSGYFHVEPMYGFCELLDEWGKEITVPGQTGEIVGTTLFNFGMPLIRYRTGDYAEYFGDECPVCHRQVQVFKKILGRWKGDKVYNRDGSFVTTTALNLHDHLYEVIDGMQYIQDKPGELIINIIPNSKFNYKYKEEFIHYYKSKLHSSSQVKIQEVNRLEKMPNGKFLLLKSSVSIDQCS